ncbi:MAG: hypothetical protein L6R38_002925 [Xanthoria sp. 2 TBL-2021]|nr:MAG: hypothetical protein L6R38_002925 [Xanthoria sp. 2 TBL-2021]
MFALGEPNLASPGMEGMQVWEGRYTKASEWKQVVVADGPERHYEDKLVIGITGGPPVVLDSPPSETPKSVDPIPNRHRWRWVIGVVLALLIVVAIVTPVGVIVARNKRSSATSTADPTSSAANATNERLGGVLRGTRLTTLEPRTGGDINLFYQTNDGSLHYISQSQERIWQGSTNLNISDAKLRTPLCSTYSNFKDGSVYPTQWWLFYIDNSNTIQNVYSQSNPASWRHGNIGSKNYKVPADPSSIAFTVSRGRHYNHSAGDLDAGLTLYTSDSNGTFRTYIYDDKTSTWSDGTTFPDNTNGQGSASLFSETRDAYLFTTNDDHAIDMWWRRYDNNTDPHDDSENSKWHLGPTSPASLARNGSLCGQYDFAFQGADGRIQGSTFTDGASPDDKRWGVTYGISDGIAIDGSGLSCWYFFPNFNPLNTRFHVFYQVEGNGIVEARRYWNENKKTVSGEWTYQTVPIQT